MINDWGTRYVGHDGVRRWVGSDAIGMNARMQILTTTTDDQTVTVRFDWSSNKFSGKSTGIFIARDGRLASFTIPPEH
ncbi:hypothetical protein [Curtobacterium sp. MCJR17_020]|uniref:hypothetical protein n=1 Tax=Curtobacterium sp. MCJR17_020 TaxID=2175619 RepID=UPI0021AC90F9|nr:hypothetical protein [Curtobacterium sp. MCJR17_020]WIE74083.1 hypothetical protein DEJ14_019190 [Curtobacterium sp. MCJR17_020]